MVGWLLVLLLAAAVASPGALATDSGPTPGEAVTESEDDDPTVSSTATPTPSPTPARPRSPSGTTSGGSESATAGTPSLVGLTVEQARRVLREAGRRLDGLDGLRDGARIVGQRESADGLMLVTIEEAEPAEGDDPGIAVPEPGETEPLDPATVPADAAQSVDDLVAECGRLDAEFDRAQLRLDDDVEMTLDEPTRLPVEVTLDIDAPSRRIVAVEDATTVDIRVTCRVKAQLRAAPEEFDIDERDWVTQSLLTERTAEWSWFVTPRRTGDAQLEVALQPVIHVDQEDAAVTGEIGASILRHPITVAVSAPADLSIGAWLDRLTNLLNSAQGLLLALTALVVAGFGFWAALRRRSSPST